ncbi:MAG: type II toxin-antitoxin system HicB family antitoxin [Actinomycetota bacterium]|nr:type II toxin-antitoxin system HicB family antitoxin [Actinomycetota bacterium]MDI6821982.1 type II toxin-antitoxin system HicB family antitoxin [Actinomycetota bacterium]
MMLKINITIPAGFLKKIDRTAKEEHLSRSEFLRKAVEAYWESQRTKQAEKKRTQNIREAMEIQSRLRKKAGKWDGVAEIRRWREAH